MKYLIASDIHGSGLHCEKLVERYKAEGAEKLLLLGDILYHGPRNPLPAEYGPPKVCELLNPLWPEILCVKGNCDSEVDEMVLRFPLLGGYAVLEDGRRSIILTHGHIFNEEHLPPIKAGDLLLHGHTHVKVAKKMDCGAYLVNPGSTSLPKDGDVGSYAVYDGSQVEIKDLEGNVLMSLDLD